MARGVLALFLALLIGNPICCCAFGYPGGTDSAAAALPSCCKAKPGGSPQPDQRSEDSPPCPCRKSPGVATGDEVYATVLFPSGLAPAARETGAAVMFSRPADAIGASIRSGPSGGYAPSASFQVLYGVFRC